jgi:predicted nucleotidyltransferase
MSRNSLDLSGKIEADLVDAFGTVARVAEELGVPYFVAGATARDIILHHGYGIRNFTFTADIDIGVKIASW